MFFTASLPFLSKDVIVISGGRILKLLAFDVRRYHKKSWLRQFIGFFLMKMLNKEEDYKLLSTEYERTMHH